MPETVIRRERFAVVGYGAITEEMVQCLAGRGELGALLCILVRPQRLAEARDKAAGRFTVVDSLAALLDLEPQVVAECAGHGAMREYAPTLLSKGVDVLCSSVGVLADREFEERIARSASPSAFGSESRSASRGTSDAAARLWIPSGAVAGIDGLLAARTAGLSRVTYTSIKAPVAWDGTPAERLLEGASRAERTTFFEGSAREAAMRYPQNANVGATVSLAGLGLDRTQVRLVSDPATRGPLGIIEAEGEFGTLRFEILAYASPRNPKTSLLTAHSMLAALREGTCFSVGPGSGSWRGAGGRGTGG